MAKITVGWEAPEGKKGSVEGLGHNLKELDDRIRRVITGEVLYHTDKATEYAKLNAPWTDQTGAARGGLHSTASVGGVNKNHWEIVVAHSMYYGIYLEVCNSGKYAIIMPTVNYIGPLLLKRMSHALDRIGARNE